MFIKILRYIFRFIPLLISIIITFSSTLGENANQLQVDIDEQIKTVQDNLGHATASFTLDVYGHVTEQMKKASSDRMEQFFNSVAPQESNKAKNKAKL